MGQAIPGISCAPDGLTPECATKADCAACSDGGFAEDVIQRKFMNVQLIAAARDGELSLLREALKGGANPETRQPMRIIAGASNLDVEATLKDRKNSGPTPLMLAAKSGSLECVKLLLNSSAKVQAKDEDGMRPVHFAALAADLPCLQVLMSARANICDRDHESKGVLEYLPDEIRRDPFEIKKWNALIMAEQANPSSARSAPESMDNQKQPYEGGFSPGAEDGTSGLAGLGSISEAIHIIR